MAKATVTMPDEIISKMTSLGQRTDDIMKKTLEAGGDVALSAVKKNLSAVIGRGTKYESRSTGELASSLGLSPVKVDRDGNYDVKVGFSEPRSDGESNAKIANILEYGRSGQKAKPFIKPAKTACRADVETAMENAFESEAGVL